MKWQPIETAPKQRKVLVGFRNELGNWRTALATYYPESTLDADEAPDNYGDDYPQFAPAGWYEDAYEREDVIPLSIEPTHWMPLPKEPKP